MAKTSNATDDVVDTSVEDKEDDSADFDEDADNASWDEEVSTSEEPEDADKSTENDDKPDKSDDDAESDDDSTEESETEVETDEDDKTVEETDKSDKDESKKDESLSPEERHTHNEAMAAARVAEREARKKADEAHKQAEDATVERYLRDAGEDEDELERRKTQVAAWRVNEEKISVNQQKLEVGVERAVASIDLFRTGSPAAKEELAQSLDDFERMYVRKDDQGRPIEVLGDVVKFLQAKAESIKKLQGDGRTQQDKAKKNQKSRTLTTPVKSPKKAKDDPAMDAFDEEAKRF